MKRAVILYDGQCGFCRWSAARLLDWDRRGKLRAAPIQSREADRMLAGVEADRRLDSWHLVTTDGRVYSAGAAVAPLLRLLPAGSPVAAFASSFPGTTERLYGLVARNRTRLGRAIGAKTYAVDPSRRDPPNGT